MQYHIEARGKTKQYIEGLLPSMLSQLSLTRSRQFLHIIVDRDIEHTGQTVPLPGIDTMLVVPQAYSQLGGPRSHTGTRVDPRGAVCQRLAQAHSQGSYLEGQVLQGESSLP